MRKTYVKVALTAAGLIVMLGLVYTVALLRSRAQLRRAYVALEQAGRPMNASDIIPPDASDSANAAVLYQDAVALLKAVPVEPRDIGSDVSESAAEANRLSEEKDLFGYLVRLSALYLRDSIRQERYVELKELMESDTVVRALACIEQGTQRPRCRFERDYDLASLIETRTTVALEVKGLAYLLATRTHLAARAGDAERAWHLAKVLVKLADALRDEPLHLSQLIRVGMIEQACDTVQRLCTKTATDVIPQDDIDEFLRTFEDITPLERALDGGRLLIAERVFAQSRPKLYKTLQQLRGPGTEPEFLHRLRFQALAFKPRLLVDHAAYLELVYKFTELLKGPYVPSDSAAYKKIDRLVQNQHGITGLMVPFYHLNPIYSRMLANVRLTRSGLELLQHRCLHGDFPQTLADLKEEPLIDPFSRKPLLYRPENDGFLIYSVGPDQTDNSGRIRAPKQDKDYDLIWRYPGARKGFALLPHAFPERSEQ